MEKVDTTNWSYPQGPSTERGRATHLTSTKDGKKFAYGSMNNVIVRESGNLQTGFTYFTQNPSAVTAVSFGPKGGKIALGSDKGHVIVWNHEREDQMVSFESDPLQTRINDIAWTDCGERMAVVGEGNNCIGKTLNTKLKKIDQDLDKHTSHGLSVAFKGNRPFKCFTGSEDTKVNFFKGPPFTFEKSIEGHSRFVNVLRCHPGNEFVVSSGSDMSLIVYDAKTGEITQTKEKIHSGSIYSLAFFDGGNKFVTCSADKTVKVWKWEGLELLHTLQIRPKPGVQDMQVGVTVTENYIISLSLSGVFNFWNLEGLSGEVIATPDFTQAGHRKNVIQVWYNENQLISVDTDGRILKFSNLGEIPIHHDLEKSVKQASFTPCGKFLAVSSSNKVLVYNTDSFELVSETEADGFINKMFILTQNKFAVVTNKSTFTLYEDGDSLGVVKLGEEGISLDISEDGSTGYAGSNRGTFYKLNLNDFTVAFKDKIGNKITSIKASHSNNLVAIGTGNGIVGFYSNSEDSIISSALKYHGNFITSLVWSPDDTRVFSSAYESTVYVWNAETLKKSDKLTDIGHRGAINQLVYTGSGFVSIGTDASIKKWEYSIN